MDLVDEEHIVRLQVGEQGSEIAGLLQHRARGGLDVDPHLVGDDVGQRGLAKAGRPEDQQMIEGLSALAGGLDEDLHLIADVILSGVIGQLSGPDGPIDDLILTGGTGRDEAIRSVHGHTHTRLRRDSRMMASTDIPSTATLVTIWLACCGL